MSYQGSYVTTQDVLNVVKFMRPDFSLSEINEAIIMKCEIQVDSIVEDLGYDTPAEDVRGMLKYATICFYLEHMAKAGEIQNKHGEVKSREMGKIKTEYDSMSPMFFFANGEARKFYGLIGHETWRMEAYHMIRAYARARYRRKTGHISKHAEYKVDKTHRGWNWNKKEYKTTEGQYYSNDQRW